MICRGHETWHPDPEFYYKHGGGPHVRYGTVLPDRDDQPARRGIRRVGDDEEELAQRTITSKPHGGEIIDVDVDTYIAGTMRFRSGAIGTLFTTFDAYYPYQARLEVYGSKGTLFVPDPNCFGGR